MRIPIFPLRPGYDVKLHPDVQACNAFPFEIVLS